MRDTQTSLFLEKTQKHIKGKGGKLEIRAQDAKMAGERRGRSGGKWDRHWKMRRKVEDVAAI